MAAGSGGKTYCDIPWVGLTLDASGKAQACCEAVGARYVDDEGKALGSSTHSFDEIRNSPVFREMRKDMLAGRQPAACAKCWQDEAVGIPSMREQRGQSNLSEERARAHTSADGAIDADALPFVPELRLSNLCNLRCRMCGPELSSAWHDEARGLGAPAILRYGLALPKGGAVQSLSSPKFRESLDRSLGNVRHIVFTGGEPLIEKAHLELIEAIRERGLASGISLSYTTNLTRLPDRILEAWESFRWVHVGVSIEGVGSVQEYVRHPVKWKTMEANIRKLDAAAAARGWSAAFQATIGAYTVLSVDELVGWFIESSFRGFNRLEIRRLWNPSHLNVRALPERGRAEARRAIERACRKIDLAPGLDAERARWLAETRSALLGLAEYLAAEDSPRDWRELVAFTRELDRSRGQDVAAALPRWAGLLDG